MRVFCEEFGGCELKERRGNREPAWTCRRMAVSARFPSLPKQF
jgi:hypothetical protein